MTLKMHPRQFETVIRLSPQERYDYFVKKVADQEELWGLWRDGWAILGDASNGQFVPVGPHPDFAAAFATGEWSNYLPKMIDLSEWLNEWIPEMLGHNHHVAIFPTPFGLAATVDPLRLREDIDLELEKYE